MVQFIYICTDETYCFYSLSTYIFKYIQIREGISFLTDSIGSPTSFIFQASGGAAVKTAEERRIKSTQRPQTVKKEKERKATSKKGGGGGRNSHSDENSDIDEAIAAYYAVRIDKNQVENILSNKTMIRRIMLFGFTRL